MPGARPVRTLRGHSEWVSSVAVSADGQFVASSSYDATVRLWNADDGEDLGIIAHHEGPVTSVKFVRIFTGVTSESPKGRGSRAAAAATVGAGDDDSGASPDSSDGGKGGAPPTSYDHGAGKLIDAVISISRDTTLRVTSISWHKDPNRRDSDSDSTMGEDGAAGAGDAADGFTKAAPLLGHAQTQAPGPAAASRGTASTAPSSVNSGAVGAPGKRKRGGVTVVNVKPPSVTSPGGSRRFAGVAPVFKATHIGPVTCAWATPTGRTIVSGAINMLPAAQGNHELRVWNLTDDPAMLKVAARTDKVARKAVSPSLEHGAQAQAWSSRQLVGSAGAVASEWPSHGGGAMAAPRARVVRNASAVNALRAQAAAAAVAAGAEGGLYVARARIKLSTRPSSLVGTHLGKAIFVGLENGKIQLRALLSLAAAAREAAAAASSVDAVDNADSSALPCRATVSAHQGEVSALTVVEKVLRSNVMLVSGSADKSVRVWRVYFSEGEPQSLVPWAVLSAHTGSVKSVALAQLPVGLCVVSGASDRSVRLWVRPVQAALACVALARWKGVVIERRRVLKHGGTTLSHGSGGSAATAASPQVLQFQVRSHSAGNGTPANAGGPMFLMARPLTDTAQAAGATSNGHGGGVRVGGHGGFGAPGGTGRVASVGGLGGRTTPKDLARKASSVVLGTGGASRELSIGGVRVPRFTQERRGYLIAPSVPKVSSTVFDAVVLIIEWAQVSSLVLWTRDRWAGGTGGSAIIETLAMLHIPETSRMFNVWLMIGMLLVFIALIFACYFGGLYALVLSRSGKSPAWAVARKALEGTLFVLATADPIAAAHILGTIYYCDDGWFDRDDPDEDLRCWEGLHWVLALLALPLYVLCCVFMVRLTPVRGHLIHYGFHLFDWREDDTSSVLVDVNLLSQGSPECERQWFMFKVLMALSIVLFRSQPQVLAAVLAGLIVATFVSGVYLRQFFDPRTAWWVYGSRLGLLGVLLPLAMCDARNECNNDMLSTVSWAFVWISVGAALAGAMYTVVATVMIRREAAKLAARADSQARERDAMGVTVATQAERGARGKG